MDENTVTTILVSAATAFSTKAVEGPIQTFNDIWNGAFGYKIKYWAKSKECLAEQNYKKYISSIDEKVSKIKEENLQEPQLSIVGPALEASKYYIEEDKIREMFANLIASSMDSTYNGLVQHSFVEIIRQLSPYDAKLFNTLEEEFTINYKTKDITIDSLNTEYTKLLVSSDLKASRGYNYKNEYFKDEIKNAISLSNLKRLGLIDFYESSELLKQNSYSISIDEVDLTPPSNLCIITYCYITALGKAFKEVCIKDSL